MIGGLWLRKAGGSSDWCGRRRLMREGQWLWLRGAGREEGTAIGAGGGGRCGRADVQRALVARGEEGGGSDLSGRRRRLMRKG